jgi:hypothetical protein
MERHKGIGLHKTGTSSLTSALDRLRFVRGGTLKFDLPECEYYIGDYMNIPKDKYQELDERFPDAKFILTIRDDVDVWYTSMVRYSKKFKNNRIIKKHRRSMYGAETPNASYRQQYLDHWFGVTGYFMDKYGEQADEKLLVVCWADYKEWESLCPFLGVEIPDERFPHRNANHFNPEFDSCEEHES